MPSIPTKQMRRLYGLASTVKECRFKDDNYELVMCDHYTILKNHGTTIYLRWGTEATFEGAYSASDRDAINGLFRCHGLPSVARIRNGKLEVDLGDVEPSCLP